VVVVPLSSLIVAVAEPEVLPKAAVEPVIEEQLTPELPVI